MCGLPFLRKDADATEFLADGINAREEGLDRVESWERLDDPFAIGG